MKLRPFALLCSLLLVPPLSAADTAASYYESALRYSQQQQWRSAELELRNSLQQDPAYLPARLLLGKVMLKAGQWASAEKELQLALDSGAAPLPLLFDLMRALLAQQKHDQVSHLLEKYQHYQKEAGYVLMQANLYKQQYQYPQALQAYQQVLAQQPQAELAAESWYGLAELQLKQSELAAAIASLDQLRSDSDWFRPGQYLRAQILQLQQKTDAAMQLYDQLLTQKPQDAAALLGKAQLLMQKNQPAAALKLIIQFRQAYPENPYGQLIQASILGQQGETKEQQRLLQQVRQQLSGLTTEQRQQEDVLLLTAVLDFSNAQYETTISKLKQYQKLYPANARVSQLLAQSYLQLRIYDEAQSQIQTAMQLNPQDYSLVLIAATIYQAQQKNAEELALLQQAFGRFPAEPQIRQSYIVALIKNGQSAMAQQLLQDPAASQPRLADLVMLGYLQLEAGAFEAAFTTAGQLLKLDQSKVEIFQLAADVSAKLGQPAQAKAFYQQVLVLDASHKPALLSLASLALQQQQWSEAAGYYQTLLQHYPADNLILQLVADSAIQQGKITEAISWLEQLPDDNANVPAQQALFELYLLENQIDKAATLLSGLSEKIALTPFLYQSLAKLALVQQQPEVVSHNTEILYGLWYDDAAQLQLVTDLQLRNQDKTGALTSIQRLIALDAEPQDLSLLQARLALLQGNPDRTLQLVAKLRQAGNNNAVLDELTAHSYLAQQRYAEAATVLQQLYQANPGYGYFQLLRQCYQQLQDQPALTSLLQQYLQQQPADLAAVIELATLYQAQQQQQAAIDLYEKHPALQQQPVLLNNLANLYLSQQPAKALQYAQAAYQLLPGQPDITDTYGYALVKAGQPAQGLGILRDAEIRQPDSIALQLHLAETLLLLQRTAEAGQIITTLTTRSLTPAEQQLLQDLQQQLEKK